LPPGQIAALMVKRLQALDHPPASEAIRALTVRGLKDRRKPHDAPVLVRFQWWSGRAHYATTMAKQSTSASRKQKRAARIFHAITGRWRCRHQPRSDGE